MDPGVACIELYRLKRLPLDMVLRAIVDHADTSWASAAARGRRAEDRGARTVDIRGVDWPMRELVLELDGEQRHVYLTIWADGSPRCVTGDLVVVAAPSRALPQASEPAQGGAPPAPGESGLASEAARGTA